MKRHINRINASALEENGQTKSSDCVPSANNFLYNHCFKFVAVAVLFV